MMTGRATALYPSGPSALGQVRVSLVAAGANPPPFLWKGEGAGRAV